MLTDNYKKIAIINSSWKGKASRSKPNNTIPLNLEFNPTRVFLGIKSVDNHVDMIDSKYNINKSTSSGMNISGWINSKSSTSISFGTYAGYREAWDVEICEIIAIE